ncbi:hypothetical protein SELMODRAFT_438334 [Selaginella moellendorffii]|uniref:Enoyl reductase (ER) domain-containing protein n=2 Tax=Selaginella moellendorffii TaxID=88036 RepID=D8QW74_SELML|nr:hypothetical protein SELMODRAFT_438334 [Selaginella moellendorffii]
MILENTCILLHGDGALALERSRISSGDMESGSVLLRMIAAEVCGTDVHLKHRRLDTVPYPIIPGHVAVGRVVAMVGSVRDVDGMQIEEGAVVTYLDVIDTCNSCVSCLVDKESTRCPKRRVLGITCRADPRDVKGLLGGWSSHIYLPPNTKIIRLPEVLPPRVFMAGGCGLPTALHAIERAGIKLMDRVLVQGSGPVGLLAALLARLSGALQVIVTGAPEHRLEVVKRFGIDSTVNIEKAAPSERVAIVRDLTNGRMADVVIEVTGRPEAIPEGMSFCRDGGTYVVVGQYTNNGDAVVNPHHLINRKHLTVKGCWGSDFSHFYKGVQLMAKHVDLPWDSVISQTVRLGDVEKALLQVEKLGIFKALVEEPEAEKAS